MPKNNLHVAVTTFFIIIFVCFSSDALVQDSILASGMPRNRQNW